MNGIVFFVRWDFPQKSHLWLKHFGIQILAYFSNLPKDSGECPRWANLGCYTGTAQAEAVSFYSQISIKTPIAIVNKVIKSTPQYV